jgi:hypothetical protein
MHFFDAVHCIKVRLYILANLSFRIALPLFPLCQILVFARRIKCWTSDDRCEVNLIGVPADVRQDDAHQ